MSRSGWVRTRINRDLGRIKHLWKWAAAEELVPASVFHGLQAVAGLKAGRCDARESEPVGPVPGGMIEAVRPLLSPTVRAVVDLMLVTGVRPGEALGMRGRDLETEGPLWVFKPASHKTQHHGHERVIPLGPKAQEVLRPLLKPDPDAYLFSPKDSEAWRREQRRAARKTPPGLGNGPGTNVKRKPSRRPGDRYTVEAFNRAIDYACEKAFPPPGDLGRAAKLIARWRRTRKGRGVPKWLNPFSERVDAWRAEHQFHPHQMRHTAATRLRESFGLEGAQVVLGHRTLSAAQVYAEKSAEMSRRIMAEVG